jgi:hypothetical protein
MCWQRIGRGNPVALAKFCEEVMGKAGQRKPGQPSPTRFSY